MARDDVVWVPVLPSLRGFAQQLSSEGRRAGEAAGRDTAAAMAASVAKGQAAVEKAATGIEKARRREQDAAGRLATAEAQLATLRSRGVTDAGRITAATEKVAKAQRDAQAATAATSTASGSLQRANQDLERRTREAARASDEQSRSVRTAAGDMREAGGSSDFLSGKLGGLAKAAGIAVAGFAGFKGVKSLMSAGFGRLTSIDDARGKLNALGHDLESTETIMESAMASVKGTAFGFGDAATIAASAVAAGIKPGQELTKYLSRIGDAATVAGVDLSEMGQILNKVQTGGGAYSAELNQLANRGIPVYQWLAEEMGVAAGEVKKLASEGKVSSEVYFAAIDKNIGGASQKMDTVSTAIANMRAAYGRLGATLLTPFFGQAIDGAGALTSMLDNLDAAAKPWAEKLGAGMNLVKGILVDGDFKGEFARAFGIEEDAPIVDTLFTIRDTLSTLKSDSLERIGNIMGTLRDGAVSLVDPLKNIITSLSIAAAGVGISVWSLLLTTLEALAPVLVQILIPPIELLGRLMADHQGVVNALVFAYTAYRGILIAATVAQWALNSAFLASPIGRIVALIGLLVAGVTLAWQNSETFRNVVTAAWEGIQSAASTAWDLLSAAFDGISAGLGWVGDKASWLWSKVEPVFSAIGTAARVLMAIVGTVLVAPFLIAFNVLSKAVELWWNFYVKPIFNFVANIAKWLWNNVLSPVFSWIGGAFSTMGSVFRTIWQAVIRVALEAFGKYVSFVWNSIIKPTFEFLKGGVDLVGKAFDFMWHKVISPALKLLGDGVKAVWNATVSPVFDSMRTGVDLVGKAFDTAAGFIEKVWDKVRGAAARPIKFVIDSVYNNGIVAAWNKVGGWLGLDPLEEYSPSWLGSYDTGGTLPGYSPGVDNLHFVSTDGRAAIDLGGGESIMRPEFGRAVGPGWVDGANAAAAHGGEQGVRNYLGAFAGGGVVDSIVGIVNDKFPGMSITSTVRPGDPGYHGSGNAVDFSDGYDTTPGMQAASRYFHDNFGPMLAELIHYPLNGWQNLKNGQPLDYGPQTNAEHRNHVHIAALQPLDPAMAGEIEPGGNWFTNAVGAVGRGLRSTVAAAFDKILDPIGNRIPDFGGSPYGQVPKAAFDKFRGGAREFLLGKAGESGGSGPDSAWEPSAGAEQWRQMMIDAYANQGYEATQAKIDAWVRQIDTESGGDPNIAQQIVDINGTGEAAGVGLGQMIPTTWAAYRDPSLPDNRRDPWAMTNAMVRYGEQKYGDNLLNMIGQGHGYDRGGIGRGLGFMPKMTLRPERVLSPEQTAAFEALVPHLLDVAANVADLPALQAAADAAMPGAGVALDAALAALDASEYAGQMAAIPAQAFEETSRDTLDFFGFGAFSDLLFADPTSAGDVPGVTDPELTGVTGPADELTNVEITVDDDEPRGGDDGSGGGRGPLVVIEQMIVDDAKEAAQEMSREARRLVRSDALAGGW